MATDTATGTLTFAKTMSLKLYASTTGATTMNLVRNPKSEKLFASFDNGASAALAKSLDKAKPMVISECTDEASGETFLMVHNPSESNVEESFTL